MWGRWRGRVWGRVEEECGVGWDTIGRRYSFLLCCVAGRSVCYTMDLRFRVCALHVLLPTLCSPAPLLFHPLPASLPIPRLARPLGVMRTSSWVATTARAIIIAPPESKPTHRPTPPPRPHRDTDARSHTYNQNAIVSSKEHFLTVGTPPSHQKSNHTH